MHKLKYGAYIVNIDEYELVTDYVALHVNDDNLTYFDSFGVKDSPIRIKKIIDHKNITTHVYRIQANNSITLETFLSHS